MLVSLTGLRIWPIETIHHYLNPAWWYLTLLIELYLVFPALWWLARRLSPTGLVVFGVLGTAAVRAARSSPAGRSAATGQRCALRGADGGVHVRHWRSGSPPSGRAGGRGAPLPLAGGGRRDCSPTRSGS
ncbi:MAG: hypothetical protein U0610_31075 [bacterium]